jgi:tetratricopeptide (TPR) repeat protein
MDGRAMTQIFTEMPAVEYVDTYEGEHPKDGVFRGEYAEDPYAALAAMQQLIDLGYVEKPNEDNAKWLHDHTNDRKNVMAHVLYSVGKFDECERLLRELLAEYPTPGLACRLIMSLLEQRKLDEAEAAAEQTASLREDMPLFMMLQGQIKFQQRDFDGAFTLFEKVLESDPRSHQVHVLLGQIHISRKRWDMAEQAFRRVLAVEPDHAEAHDGLGVALAAQGNLEDGVFHLMQSAALLHHRWLTHYNLGLVLLDLDRVDWAIRAMETASELAPDNPEPHRVLARVYRVRKNDVENSLKHMRLMAEKRAKIEKVQPGAVGENDGDDDAVPAEPAPAK